MIYKIKFLPSAFKEWKKLAPPIQQQFKKKLQERILRPRIAADQLRGFKDIYKIKLRSVGYRLVYEVVDNEITIYVIAVGRRDHGIVYDRMRKHLQRD